MQGIQPKFKLSIALVLLGSLSVLFLSACDLNSLLKQGSTKKTAILYGVSIYIGATVGASSFNLQAPAADVASLQSLLQSQGWNVIARTNTTATISQLRADVALVQASVEAGQRVMFYFSGHGMTFPYANIYKSQWIFLKDSLPGGFTGLSTGANDTTISTALGAGVDAGVNAMLNPSQLAALFQPIADRQANLIFVLDSCYSGGFVANGSYSSDLPADYSTAPYLGGQSLGDSSMLFQSMGDYFSGTTQGGALVQPNIWTLSAAGSNEASYETSTLGHGIFTYAILIATDRSNGFMNADYNHDNYITLQELYRFSKEFIDLNWNKYSLDGDGLPSQYLPHLSGNPLDILIFR